MPIDLMSTCRTNRQVTRSSLFFIVSDCRPSLDSLRIEAQVRAIVNRCHDDQATDHRVLDTFQQLMDAARSGDRERQAVEEPAVIEIGGWFQYIGQNAESATDHGANESIHRDLTPVELRLFTPFDSLVLVYKVPDP